ncbi:MAG: zinc ribbon domain-containing protein [Desulfurococcales archaeon]|nr:zinc ribbon domain-containing protein [Desulfurococcales archaeon]
MKIGVQRIVTLTLLFIVMIQVTGVGGHSRSIIGSAFKQGFKWVYISTVEYGGYKWNETIVVEVLDASDLGYVVRESAFYEGEDIPYAIQIYYLDGNSQVVTTERIYVDSQTGLNQTLIVDYDKPIPFVFWPSGVGDGLSVESPATVYNGTTGEAILDLLVRYKYEATGQKEVVLKGRIVQFILVEGTMELYDLESMNEPFYTINFKYYINNDFIMPAAIDSNDSDGVHERRILNNYIIEPDPVEKYPLAEQEKLTITHKLSIAFVVEGNYTKSPPMADIEIYSQDKELLYTIPFSPGDVSSIELPEDTYILSINPPKGMTEDNVGSFYIKNWIYNGRIVTGDTIEVRLTADLEVKIVLVAYYIQKQPTETTTTEARRTTATETATPIITATETTTREATATKTTKEAAETPGQPQTGGVEETRTIGQATGATRTTSGVVGTLTTRQQGPSPGGAPGVVPPVTKEKEPFYKTTIGIALIVVAIAASSAGAVYVLRARGAKPPRYQPPLQQQTIVRTQEKREPSPPRSTIRYPAIPPPQQTQPQPIPVKRQAKKKCPYCNAEIPVQAKYCPRCGSPQPNP